MKVRIDGTFSSGGNDTPCVIVGEMTEVVEQPWHPIAEPPAGAPWCDRVLLPGQRQAKAKVIINQGRD
jgi:hypothetical protein